VRVKVRRRGQPAEVSMSGSWYVAPAGASEPTAVQASELCPATQAIAATSFDVAAAASEYAAAGCVSNVPGLIAGVAGTAAGVPEDKPFLATVSGAEGYAGGAYGLAAPDSCCPGG
jgi:hypothetical protein